MFAELSRTGQFRAFRAISAKNWDGSAGQIGTPDGGEEERGREERRERGDDVIGGR